MQQIIGISPYSTIKKRLKITGHTRMAKNFFSEIQKKERRLMLSLQVLFLVCFIFLFLIKEVCALPPPPNEYYGTVIYNNARLSSGSTIYAYDENNVACGYFNITTSGFFGLLSCSGDDTQTLADEGATSSSAVTFYADGTSLINS